MSFFGGFWRTRPAVHPVPLETNVHCPAGLPLTVAAAAAAALRPPRCDGTPIYII